MSHSPGPWRAHQKADDRQFVIRTERGAVVAQINGPYTPGHDREAEDAALIAAAPDLLAVLRPIAEFAGDKAPPLAMVQQWAADALAAITKAQGS